MTAREMETVVLAGNPNVGKTTLFNALTGKTGKVANVAGATVDLKTGETFTPHGQKLRIVDLPGCLSLNGEAPDQQLARRALLGELEELGKPDLALCVLDASNLERNLMLALEVIEAGLPVIVVLNMIDVAEASGIRLDPVVLSEELGVPIVPVQANKQHGIVELKQAIRHPLPPASGAPWASAEHPVEARQQLALELCELAARRPDSHQSTLSDKLDAQLIHPVLGWVYLIAIMFAVFWSIFSFAAIPMGWVEAGQGWLEGLVAGAMPEGDFRDLIISGIIGGVGSVVVFLPQILILFFFIGLLESSGYMARAAFMMDGLMSKVGLSGKAFLPLLSSYACAIPGIMATRSIDSAKERLTTIFVAPWMSCTARLPVYFLLIPMLLGGSEGGLTQALVLLAIYVFGTLSAFVVARVLRGRLGEDAQPRHFTLELPPYRAPQWGYVFRHLADRGWSFLRKAGTVIMGISIVLWALSTYPKSDSDDPAEMLQHSLMGRISSTVEPVVRPLGFDGRTGTAVLTSFAAREVFNASMFQLFRVEEIEEDETASRDRLRQRLAEETWEDGTAMFRPLTVISLLIFYIYALQCLPTSAVTARESGSWKWAAGQFVFMTGVAALGSLLVYQVGSLLGF
ncbi:ferrous iron transporter B [Haloferula sp. A504]|uniref:ferrous iron transporter B n=1 Tax=Haloferula sp. A504 TaxID=3373601 RepID=UPI0031C8C81A|nr:ferrous iron transporter B [Verrucomicrobiaceae bacterium E54]